MQIYRPDIGLGWIAVDGEGEWKINIATCSELRDHAAGIGQEAGVVLDGKRPGREKATYLLRFGSAEVATAFRINFEKAGGKDGGSLEDDIAACTPQDD